MICVWGRIIGVIHNVDSATKNCRARQATRSTRLPIRRRRIQCIKYTQLREFHREQTVWIVVLRHATRRDVIDHDIEVLRHTTRIDIKVVTRVRHVRVVRIQPPRTGPRAIHIGEPAIYPGRYFRSEPQLQVGSPAWAASAIAHQCRRHCFGIDWQTLVIQPTVVIFVHAIGRGRYSFARRAKAAVISIRACFVHTNSKAKRPNSRNQIPVGIVTVEGRAWPWEGATHSSDGVRWIALHTQRALFSSCNILRLYAKLSWIGIII